MNTRPLILASLLVAALLAVFGWWAAEQLPPGTELPTHWNMAGEVDDWMPALQALMVAPAILLFVTALFALIPRLEPLQDRLEASAPLLAAVWWAMIGLAIFLQGFMAAPVFGIEARSELILVAVGGLFLILGNMLPKSRPGFFVGIRTPWTITDTDNWIATHRLGGKSFIAGGVLMIVAGLVPMTGLMRTVIVIAAIVMAGGVPTIYSWWLWQRRKPAA